MSSDSANTTFDDFHNGIFTIIGGTEPKKVLKYVAGGIIAILLVALVAFVIYKLTSSGFGNGRVVGSGCGRYNQLQRAINMEFPISQTEYESAEIAKQEAAGIQYANSWQPPMENVYAAFQDRKNEAVIEHYQQKPTYPQVGITQSVYNDNVFKNIAYDA